MQLRDKTNVKGTLLKIGVPIAVVLGISGIGFGQYNNFVEKQATVEQAYAKIDVSLQRRLDLIPNILESVKGYMSHEKDLLTEIANSRSNVLNAKTTSDRIQAQTALDSGISRFLVAAESYPELKANDQVGQLINQLEGTENRIFVARADYNEAATSYNVSIKRMPGAIIANMAGFDEAELFEADKEAKDAPKISFE